MGASGDAKTTAVTQRPVDRDASRFIVRDGLQKAAHHADGAISPLTFLHRGGVKIARDNVLVRMKRGQRAAADIQDIVYIVFF